MRGVRSLSLAIGVTGLVSYAYFSLSSYALSPAEYGEITLLWSAVFISVGVLYRPVEQLLSRTIANHEAQAREGTGYLRVAGTIQLALGLTFTLAAIVFRRPLEDELFGGSAMLYWVLIVAVVAYAASYFARGFLAGHNCFGLYGALVLMESVSRCLFAIAVGVGIASGQTVVALGMVAAPIVSLAVVPWALRRRLRPERAGRRRGSEALLAADGGSNPSTALEATEAVEPRAEGGRPDTDLSLARGGGFAAAVLVIMLAEQTLLNAGPLLVKVTEGARGAPVAGAVFNVLLVVRAPLQLFQAVQTTILPHLTRLRAGGETDDFRRSIEVTLAAIGAFAGVVVLGMLALGPPLMDVLFGGDSAYSRGGLVLVSLGMGLYLVAATLNQAALARTQARGAALSWAVSVGVFVTLLAGWRLDDRVLQVEVAFVGAAAVLCALLGALYRRHERSPSRGGTALQGTRRA